MLNVLTTTKVKKESVTLDPSSIHVNTTDINIPEPLMVISNEPIDYDILNDCLEDGTNRWTQEKRGEQETTF